MKQHSRLRSLLVAVLLASNLLVFVLSAWSLYNSREQYELRARTQTQNVAKAVEQSLTNSIGKIDLALRTVADELERQLAAGGINETAMLAFIARQEGRLPEVEAFRVSDAEGLVILGKGLNKQAGIRWADRDYFIHHRDNAERRLFVSKPVMGRVAKKYIMGFAQRYNYPDGRFAGVISAPIALTHFSQLLASFELGPNGVVALRDIDLGLIARFPPIPDQPAGQVGNNVVSPELKSMVEAGVTSSVYFPSLAADGVQRVVAFGRLSAAPIIFAVGVATNDYLRDWKNEVFKTSTMALGYLLLSVLLGGVILRLIRDAERDQRALAERELRLKTVIDNEPECIKVLDASGALLEMNQAGLKMIEADSMQQVRGCKVVDLVAPAYQAAFAAMHARVMSGQPGELEFEVLGLKGGRRWLETHAVPMADKGEIRHLAITRDVSARKQAEVALMEQQRHLERLVEERTAALMATEARASHIVASTADGLFGIDADGRITFMNPAACELLGYAPEAVVGQYGHALFHHSRPDGTPYPLAECPSHNALRLGQKVRVDNEVYWHADGHPIPVMYAIHPIVDAGQVSGAVVSFVDMSEQHEAARAREGALIAAENLAQVRSQFLANMSHEIRTPLNGVLGFARIGLRACADPVKARESFEKILRSGERLLGVINDVLDFSKIEAGKLRIEQTRVDLRELIEHSLDLLRDRIEAKPLALNLDIDPGLPASCLGDPLRIGQVLLNVLSNAVKFTEQGTLSLSACLRGDHLCFRVADTGVGMSETQLAAIFTPFQQADASSTRRFGGTGLGLAISKQILDLMRGDIRVESRLGEGTVVEFSLPYLPLAPAAEVQAVAAAPGAGRRFEGISFLVAEDEPVNQEIIKENLLEDGARVVLVDNGLAAVERILADGPAAYDFVLMDVQMPVMDGYEASRRILERAPALPIIAQTAHAFAEDRARCEAAGMIGHVAKPIDMDALQQLVDRHLGRPLGG